MRSNAWAEPSLPRTTFALINSLFVTVAFTTIPPPLSNVSVWLPMAPAPIVNAAAVAVSNTSRLIVTPSPRSIVVNPLPGPLNVAVSPVPGTIAGFVNQLVLVDQSPSVEPSQTSLVALPVVGNNANALKKSSDEMLLERMRHFASGERMAAEEERINDRCR